MGRLSARCYEFVNKCANAFVQDTRDLNGRVGVRGGKHEFQQCESGFIQVS